MKLKLKGRRFSTFNVIIEEVSIGLTENVDFSIRHGDIFTDVIVGDNQWYFEKDSLEYRLINK